MGASYANAPDGTATGASSFYTLVVLTLYLAAIVPILLTRLAKGNKNATTLALALSCAGSFVAFKRVHPAAVAWADASSVFDPYDILQIPSTANATVVKKAYRSLSRTAHPDKGEMQTPSARSRTRTPHWPVMSQLVGTTGTSATPTARGRPSRASRCRTASRRRPSGCTC